MSVRELAIRFNDAITARDLDALVVLMTDDHRFIDTAGNVVEGLAAARDAWRAFFTAYSEYQNHFETFTERDNYVAITGHSTCSEPRLAGRGLWSAEVRDGRISEWRVFEDTPATRAQLGL